MYNNYFCPDNDFELSSDGGSFEVLVILDNLPEDDLYEQATEEAIAGFERIKELCPDLDSIDKCFQLKSEMRESQSGYVLNYLPDGNSEDPLNP